MKNHSCIRFLRRLFLCFGLVANTAGGTTFMLDVDFGGDTPAGKTGPAAIGQSSNDYWNVYLRNDGMGGWRTFGTIENMKLVDGTATPVGMTVSNAPGAWAAGSSDPMYNDYIYPFFGDAAITLTGLAAGLYDLYAYSVDGNYELTVGGLSYGVKHTFDSTVSNPPVWTEGMHYALFSDVALDGTQPVTVTVRNGEYGYAIIAGLQIVAVPEPHSATLLGPALLGLAWIRSRRQRGLNNPVAIPAVHLRPL